MFDFLNRLFSSKSSSASQHSAGSMATDLSELPTELLVKEIERRLACLNKPERRLVLIGTIVSNS
jgi:hypothetical protein